MCLKGLGCKGVRGQSGMPKKIKQAGLCCRWTRVAINRVRSNTGNLKKLVVRNDDSICKSPMA